MKDIREVQGKKFEYVKVPVDDAKCDDCDLFDDEVRCNDAACDVLEYTYILKEV
jgi:hypothetical protein